ncbi:MAG: hypothetical protein ACI4TF_10280 [Oliverpabstia sp.]
MRYGWMDEFYMGETKHLGVHIGNIRKKLKQLYPCDDSGRQCCVPEEGYFLTA